MSSWPSKNPNDFYGPGGPNPRRGERPSAGEGRTARSTRLVGESWRWLRREPRLLILPAVAAVACVAAAVLVFIPVEQALDGLRAKPRMALAAAAMSLPLTFITVFCNVGFLTMARAVQDGREPSVRGGLRCATRMLPVILAWTLLSWAIGSILSLLEQVPAVGGLAGRILGFLGGLAWALATFFVVPVLVMEHEDALTSVRTSARTFRRRWGEVVTADVGIGMVFGFAMIPGFAAIGGGLAGGSTAAVLVGLVWVTPMIALSSALTELFTLQLYCEDVRGPFSQADLDSAVKPRKRPWWRRGR